MDPRATPDVPAVPARDPASAGGGFVDVEAILREVEALAGIAMKDATASSATPTPATETKDSTLPAADVSLRSANPNESRDDSMQESSRSGGLDLSVSGNGSANLDIAALERELESLLRGNIASDPAAEPVGSASGAGESVAPSTSDIPADPAVSTQSSADPAVADVRIAAFGETSADPMLREIEEILDDSNDAVLRRSEGSIDRALDTVFDPRALSGQEEDVHRALIEAFGTSRRPTPTFGGEVAIVTNPAPRFEGISRAVPPEIASTARGATPSASDASSVPTRTFEEIAASSMARSSAPEYAGEKPFEPAFPSVPPIAPAVVDEHPIAVAMPVTTPIPAATVVATNTPPAAEVPAPSTGVSAPGTPPVSVAATSTTTDADRSTPEISANSDEPRRPSMIATLLARTGRIIASVALLPAQLCALPMRFVPANARNYVSVAAISMALWVPVAWWMAERSTQAPGIGRVEFPVAPAAGHAEGDATDEHADGKTDSHPDASHDAEPDAHTSEPAGGHH